MKNIHKIKENIYITSDEEIKEGDSYIRIDTGLFFKSLKGSNPNIIKKYCKKIILTTDPQLIADGIQAIDDEFLEWFVKNPSCEEVEVNKLCYGALSGYADAGYKIITPKEQQKQHLIDMMKADEELGLYDEDSPAYNHQARLVHDLGKKIKLKQESFKHKVEVLSKEEILENRSNAYEFIDFDKQETLEEAAEKYSILESTPENRVNCKEDFIAGAKWQAERMYSEEDMLKSFMAGIKCESNKGENFEQFIKQFKNK